MARKSFLPAYRGRGWSLGMGVIRQRPELMLLIADAITIWPFIEHFMAMSLGILLGSNTDAALAVFATLRTGRNQRDAITAAAEAARDERDQELITACLSAFRTAERIRNDLAHGNWGVLGSQDNDPEALIWIESKFHAPWNTAVLVSEAGGVPRPTHEALTEHMFVYSADDLREAITTLEGVMQVARDLVSYLRWKTGQPETRETLYDRLSTAPLVREALAHLRLQKGKRLARN